MTIDDKGPPRPGLDWESSVRALVHTLINPFRTTVKIDKNRQPVIKIYIYCVLSASV